VAGVHAPQATVLAGQHVRLEPVSSRHLPDLVAIARDEAVWRWLPSPRPQTEPDLSQLFARHVAEHPMGQIWAVVHEARTVGATTYLDVDLDVEGLEVGWTWYASDVWGTSVNPECKLLLLGHAFEQLGAARVTLKTDARNARSRSAITRLGAHEDGTLRHHRRRVDGSVRDTTYFSLLAAEWPPVRLGLQARLA